MTLNLQTPPASPAMPVTVREVLALPVVRRAVPEVLAGQDMLDREIRWVHSGEVPNMASLLKGGELLLTTGMGIGNGKAERKRFIATLANRGIAALAVELGTALDRVPDSLIEAAERHDLCLIAFHREVRFVEITEAVHREIIDQGGELLRRGDALHRRFTALLLSGAKVPDVLVELSRFIANPVVLERAGHGIAYHVCHEADDATVLSAWTSFRHGHAAAPEAMQEQVPMGDETSWGRLVALAVDSPLRAQDRVAVERAVGLIALELARTREEESLASRQRGDFLSGLTTTRASEPELRGRARELGFLDSQSALLPIAVSRAPDATGGGEAEEPNWQQALADLRAALDRQGVPVLAGSDAGGEQLLLVLGLADREDRGRHADLVASTLAAAAPAGVAAIVCVGPAAETWLDTGKGLRDATEALLPAAQGDPRPWHDVSTADTDRLLWVLREQPALRRFTELQLRPLIERDSRGQAKLMPTLAAFCRHGGRKAETARALHIERQSLYHRLARIEETLEVDLSDGETVLGLYLALRASRHLEIA